MARLHGDRLLLVETLGSGLLAVLDGDAPLLAAERERLAKRDAAAALPIEVIDRASWQAMQRLAAAGLGQLADGGRVLQRASDLVGYGAARPDPAALAADLLRKADRSTRMALVLAAGGFAEEAVPLLTKAMALGAGAALVRRDELPANAAMATPDQVRDLAEPGDLATESLSTLTALWSGSGHAGSDVGRLAKATGRVLAAL